MTHFVPGPDFPTGGIIVDSRESILETYRTGRGSFRIRARWCKEEGARGVWNAVVTEIPYGVQKSRLIEKLAELVNERKLPLLADVRDESAEDVRIVLEPRARNCRRRRHDGKPVPHERAGNALRHEHECAGRWRDAARVVAVRGPAPMARPSSQRAGAPLALSPRRDRAPARSFGRHDHRLPQSRRGDSHHPRGGGAQGRAEGAVRAHRQPGQLHPRHAPALPAPPGGNAAAQRARRTDCAKRAISKTWLGDDVRQWKTITGASPRDQEEMGPADGARQEAHHIRGAARRVGGFRSQRYSGRARAGHRGRHAKKAGFAR